jgi:hypothetical protein
MYGLVALAKGKRSITGKGQSIVWRLEKTRYNPPRLHVAIEARKIVVSGEAAGLQLQLVPPAVPGRFDSCDLPPIYSVAFHSLK